MDLYVGVVKLILVEVLFAVVTPVRARYLCSRLLSFVFRRVFVFGFGNFEGIVLVVKKVVEDIRIVVVEELAKRNHGYVLQELPEGATDQMNVKPDVVLHRDVFGRNQVWIFTGYLCEFIIFILELFP